METEEGGGVTVTFNDLMTMTPYKWRKLSVVEKRIALTRAKKFKQRFTEIVSFMEHNRPKPQASAFPLKGGS